MSEFKFGIFNLLKKLVGHSSLSRAVIYTIGHIIIAATCNMFITGADINLAAIDAIVEPIINGMWFYLLDKAYTSQLLEKR